MLNRTLFEKFIKFKKRTKLKNFQSCFNPLTTLFPVLATYESSACRQTPNPKSARHHQLLQADRETRYHLD
jgi:hypothetical protein